jgi:hypothetical protein
MLWNALVSINYSYSLACVIYNFLRSLVRLSCNHKFTYKWTVKQRHSSLWSPYTVFTACKVFIWYTTKRLVTKRPFTERPGYKTSRLPNVHFTKRPDYKTSRTQNVQDTKRPVLVNLKTCFKKPNSQYVRNCILYAVYALRPRAAKLWLNYVPFGHLVLANFADATPMRCAVHGCVPTLCWNRSGLVVGTQWAGG